MNDVQGVAGERRAEPDSAFGFEGQWREFLPIALTNLLLIIVTLGIYRFWAKARERRYLWSRTRFIDETLEWTGTGLEMLIGFLIVFAALVPVLLIIQFVLPALLLRGEAAAAFAILFGFYAAGFYLIGVARFRALRYRLSRTYWHGIRGGSDDGGWYFGWQFVWKTLVGSMVLGLLILGLWNDRWNKMSFGQHPFTAGADTQGLFLRWLLVYIVPIVAIFVVGGAMVGLGAALQTGDGGNEEGAVFGMVAAFVVVYLAYLLATLSDYAAFYRQVVSATSVGGIDFEFTLGVGLLFLGYRNWSFAVRHMEATGEVNLDTLLQSPYAATGDAEGLADAFDIGAI